MGAFTNIFGKKPTVPTIEGSQSQAAAANLAILPESAKLAALVNQYTTREIESKLDTVLGTDRKTRRALMNKNTEAMLRGDVEGLGLMEGLNTDSAAWALESGAGSGAGGISAFRRAKGYRDEKLRLMMAGADQELKSAESWINQANAAQVGLYNMTGAFITPQMAFERNWLASKVDAAPDPKTRGIYDMSMELLGIVLSVYGGGSGYKGGYKRSDFEGGGSEGGGSGGGGGGGWFFGGSSGGSASTQGTGEPFH